MTQNQRQQIILVRDKLDLLVPKISLNTSIIECVMILDDVIQEEYEARKKVSDQG